MTALEAVNLIVGIMVAVFCGGAIPFGFRVERRLARIETVLEQQAVQGTSIAAIDARVKLLELAAARGRNETGKD